MSVEKVEQALKAIEYPGVATVQIIFNMFRQRPAGLFFEQARRRDVGVIVRVPLASGLLTGKLTRETRFARTTTGRFNRHGEQFDVGETFAGVDFERGLEAVEELRPLVPEGMTMAQLALRWILGFDAVSTAIPGAKTPEQARANATAAELPPLPPATPRRDRGTSIGGISHRRCTYAGSALSGGVGRFADVACSGAAGARDVRLRHLSGEGLRLAGVGECDHRPAETAARQPCRERAVVVGQVDKQVDLGGGDFEIVAAGCQDRRSFGDDACEIYRDLLYTNVELVI